MELHPFKTGNLPIDISTHKWLEISSDSKLFQLLSAYIPEHADGLHSGRAQIMSSESKKANGNFGRIGIELGLGWFSFRDNSNHILHALHQVIGQPVGTSCGPAVFSNLVIFTDSSIEALSKFLTFLVEESEQTELGTFKLFSWHMRHQYWQTRSTVKARPLESVVLPSSVKERLIEDLQSFLSVDTREFYARHGIPYRRSYLFYGVPGAGKTSLIQALAGHFKRSISYLQPTHPEMTDESIAQAIGKLNEHTIVVFEDIDSLFAADRSSKVTKSSLTFSGLLNALDGVGSACGQIFVLTTNLRDELDPALIRNGRVDMHVEFSHANNEQMQNLWISFYPQARDLAPEFAARLGERLAGRQVAAAGLQHFFVRNMRNAPEQALENVDWILEDLREKEANPVAPRSTALPVVETFDEEE